MEGIKESVELLLPLNEFQELDLTYFQGCFSEKLAVTFLLKHLRRTFFPYKV